MDTLVKKWQVWAVTDSHKLIHPAFEGSIENCVRFVEPRLAGAYAILPAD